MSPCLPPPSPHTAMCPCMISVTLLVRRNHSSPGGLLLWEVLTESTSLRKLLYPFVTSHVRDIFHFKCFKNIYEIGELLKRHFFVESKPDFLLHSAICRYQVTVTLQQCREKGFFCLFVLSYSSGGSMGMDALHVGQSSVL